MYNFEIKTKISCGIGALESLKDITNKKIFIITDPFMIESKTIDKILINLEGNDCNIFSEIVPDPPIEIVVKGMEKIKDYSPDIIIALGGGSAIDAAKAIMDFSKQIFKINEIEFIAIPTTSGTGSEVTSFSVITDAQKGTKYPLVSADLIPNKAILDPELVKTVPNFITADTGMDVLTHAIEAYVSTDSNDFSDALAEKAIKLVHEYLIDAYKDGSNLEAREKMHNASCMAGLAFNQASLGLNHGIAHIVGAKFHIPHGRTNSILLPYVIEYNANISGYNNASYSDTAKKYAQIAKMLGLESSNVRLGVKNLVNEIKKMQKSMNMPMKLTDCKVNKVDVENLLPEIAQLALKDGCTKTNPRIPNDSGIIDILKQII
ncbi:MULTISPECIES: 1-propanol dehydrogenase PduQ [Paraclostridium]|uniref:1-propanol dehydrogenase PduQ n=1 Tax=Paraclostridium TaxID=1849822 RepID=UPI0003FD5EE1|nr:MULTISPECIES: 1-propanol dehydrogenase PduQ [Paraclostridium]MBZ6004783.1 iron-containing alcohol dehydrogenase [Paraclostridium bifermentans]MDU0296531.1 1-propanol dehydrogenase PduQ [Paraclostridium sp. MRS3W1]GKZ02567.1 alcohol dehydrogenase [Paraclostridium bifermentans]GKZ05967.1 alcohol dehydrogenase [Paraclostridium bifermentans]GKZ09024.1 alcohol dehydrogenase [Paraclostridium bifermentans]